MSVTPDKTITIAGKEYTLRGTMGVLKALQQEFDEDVYELAQIGVMKLRFDQLARLIALAIGEGAPEQEAIEQEIVQEVGLTEMQYLVWEWLLGSVSPKKEREKNVKRLLAQINKIKQAAAAAKN